MKVTLEIFCSDAEGLGTVLLAKDIEVIAARTDASASPVVVNDFKPHTVHSWHVYLPNGNTLGWSALGWGPLEDE